ncbi:MAG: hypothetical protein M1828_006212 [Chrysothrix sp. TS-e1954]|nr:MAG: hypothetical protein M1828_006212 [Chrysothrix sp. TS-e1954]
MATSSSPHKPDFKITMPPPNMHERTRTDIYGTPLTPGQSGFTSPSETPQGSPSKKQLPPGAHELPDVFDKALKLVPTAGQPNWQSYGPPSPTSPSKGRKPLREEDGNDFRASVIQDENINRSGSPTRFNKENTPPGPGLAKGSSFTTHAAVSRQEPYRTRDQTDSAHQLTRGLSPETLEKLSKPSVRRLANVTQLYFLDYYFDLLSYVHNRQTRLSQFQSQNPAPPSTPDTDYQASLSKYLGRERAHLRKRRTRLRSGDFHILTQVGQGGYGQVYLATKKDTREICALKVMSKKLLFKMDEIRHVLTERDILTNANSEWLVRLLYAFQDDRSIYLAMEYVPGGDFRTLLNNTGVLHNRHARFYIAEMFACVDAVHQLGYIHRDLKPENFLVDSTGHVKLTDFGLAAGMLVPAKIESMRLRLEQVGNTPVPFSAGKAMDQRTVTERQQGYRSLRERDQNYAKSIVGSPDYMAPEILQGRAYDFTVDYWSLGCMLFEGLAGYPPFAGATVDETWRNLKEWDKVFKKPVYEDPNYFLSKRTWSLICHCITFAEKRFRSFKEIQAHPYFSEVDWTTLRDPVRGQPAPFIPELEGETDAGYFDDFSSEKDMAKYKEVHEKQKQLEEMDDRGGKMDKSLFVGFTFRHKKPSGAANGGSPRKGLSSLSEEDTSDFGTMF